MRNLSSKSLILAPFNTTKSDVKNDKKDKIFRVDTEVMDLMVEKQ
jgi:hypothetical protein